MCLIAYVPAGKALTRAVFDQAYNTNSDGIGVMSIKGVEKFFGSKALKRARNYVDSLVAEKVAHAVHWRFATHGSKQLALCHPFKLPNADVYLMHNGVLSSTAQDADEDSSDTLLYVNKLVDAPQSHEDLDYWSKICTDIGRYNKACVMYPDGHFIILNKDEGKEIDGIWYSNQYSLPSAMRQNAGYFTPARLRPKTSTRWQDGGHWVPYQQDGSGGYYETGTPSTAWGGPFGSMIYWSPQFNCYGFWESGGFVKLAVGKASVQDTTAPVSPPPPTALTPDQPQRSLVLEAGERCPRCNRPKNRTAFYVECFCDPLELSRWYAAQGIKQPLASGPQALDSDTETLTNGKTHEGMCEHGEVSWENCKECINRLETGDETRLPPDNGGHSTDPNERADELATAIIDLSKARNE